VRDEEFFANYGTCFRFPRGCECHFCRRHVAASCCQTNVLSKPVDVKLLSSSKDFSISVYINLFLV